MTDLSIINAAKSLLTTNVPTLKNVYDILEAPPDIPPDLAPAIIIHDVNKKEVRFSGANAGGMQRNEDLDLHLIVYYKDLVGSSAAVRGLMDSIEKTFRDNPYLGGLASTATTYILIASQQASSIIDPWVEGANGSILYHALMSVHVVEFTLDGA